MPKIICFIRLSFAYRKKEPVPNTFTRDFKQKEIKKNLCLSLILEDNEETRRILIQIGMQMAQKVTDHTDPEVDYLKKICFSLVGS
jgi:hypothetical protein